MFFTGVFFCFLVYHMVTAISHVARLKAGRKREVKNIGRTIVILGTLLFAFSAHGASTLNESDNGEFLRAVEDYRFGDFDPAIKTFEKLNASYPDHPELIRYLALSYEESRQYEPSLKYYRQWISIEKGSRDAHLGQARVLTHLKRYDDGAALLSRWLKGHGDDVEATMQYGNLLLLDKKYNESKKQWSYMLSHYDLSQSYQAAAHYYLAHIAYLQQDVDELERRLNAAVEADPDGQYAEAAENLRKQGKPVKRDGFFGRAELGGYYSSNVKLLPDIVSTGSARGDYFTQLGVMLEYRFSNYSVGYSGTYSSYRNEKDYNLNLQSGFLQWRKEAWHITPRYEYASLGGEYLYQAGGADIGWLLKDLYLSYSFRAKEFSGSYGFTAANLKRLGGISNTVAAQYVLKSDWDVFTFGIDLHDEATKGDATHAKSDSYRQVGGTISYQRRSGAWSRGLNVRGYYRLYHAPDTAILLTGSEMRMDKFFRVGGHVQYNISDRQGIQLKAHWQDNKSNYEAPIVSGPFIKSYSEWQAGVNWRYAW